MNLDEFEAQTRDAIEETLNQLQTATLLVSELESKISQTGQAVQALGQMIESFVAEQRHQRMADNEELP